MAVVTLSPYKRSQFRMKDSNNGEWIEYLTSGTINSGSSTGSIPWMFSYGSVAFNTSAYVPNSNRIVSSVKLLITPKATATGYAHLAFFRYDTTAAGQIRWTTSDSVSVSGTSTASFTLSTSMLTSYNQYLGVFLVYTDKNDYFGYPNRDFDVKLEITYVTYSPVAPDTLSPNNISRNPKQSVALSWRYVPSDASNDTQTSSTLRYRINSGSYTTIVLNNKLNTHTFPAGTFANGSNVSWQVATTSNIGTSAYSSLATFNIAVTPPLQSILVSPLNTSKNGASGVLLEWLYNSLYDTNPSRFDIRYNIDGGAWVSKTTDGRQNVMTEPITIQSKITWQVLAYGEWDDVGQWSELGEFWTIGAPDAPVIISATNSNRPVISFSAENPSSWEIQIVDGTNIIYDTGNQKFTNEFSYKMTEFLANGSYVVKMRVTNEYSFVSEWSELAFTIDTITPEPLFLRIVSNPNFNIRLLFDNPEEKTVYIYRSHFRENKYLRIARTTGAEFEDFTARPGNARASVDIRYDYFVRVVSSENSFSDSNIETGSLFFLQTTIAEHSSPKNMIMFIYAMDSIPTKDISFTFEKSLTQFIGRESPVMQIGDHSQKSISFSFYCPILEYEKLEQLHRSGKVLILRDWRVGVVYGTINGTISASRETNGCNVSFVFTQTDFNEEVDLL